MYQAIAASNGYARGKARWVQEKYTYRVAQIEDIGSEWQRFRDAIEDTKQQILGFQEQMKNRLSESDLQIFDAHLLLLEDPVILDQVQQQLADQRVNVEAIFDTVMERFASVLMNVDDEYIKQRATDIQDVKNRVLSKLTAASFTDLNSFHEPVILLARDITPSKTAAISSGIVKGFITMSGGRSSHTTILARTLQIPAIVGAGQQLIEIQDGDELLMDGSTGEFWVNPTEAELSLFLQKQSHYHAVLQELESFKSRPTTMKNGDKVELACNIGHPKDVDDVLEVGVDGIGLFRTEFLFMDRQDFPTEEEQFLAYKDVLEKMDGKPVIIRTLDIGGDKFLTYFPIEETNPFLGYRAIRICLDQPELFKTQLRALYRASRYGNLKIMLPMIATVEEILQARTMLDEVREQLQVPPIPVGIMIETPAAAMMIDHLADYADFFSIGSNDLTQYVMSADRTNEKVAHLYDALQPAVLRMIHLVIQKAHEKGKWIGMCGDMAGDERALPVLQAMGLDEFSMSAGQVLAARKVFSSLSTQQCQQLLDRILCAKTKAEVEEILAVNKNRNHI